jgi:hypothetical protein
VAGQAGFFADHWLYGWQSLYSVVDSVDVHIEPVEAKYKFIGKKYFLLGCTYIFPRNINGLQLRLPGDDCARCFVRR